uniref:26S proteasome non-ATPase regulatory subunit 3 C-terminal domain-containing protein n=1 Tax=Glossina brevipalpis TaxID=37001 RepID=A0A1A9WUL4_9MUSC
MPPKRNMQVAHKCENYKTIEAIRAICSNGLSYWLISPKDIARRLMLDSAKAVEFIVSKLFILSKYLHSQINEAMRYPPKSYRKDFESAKERREREQQDLELAKEMAEEDEMDFNFLSLMLSGIR